MATYKPADALTIDVLLHANEQHEDSLAGWIVRAKSVELRAQPETRGFSADSVYVLKVAGPQGEPEGGLLVLCPPARLEEVRLAVRTLRVAAGWPR